ncbi:MAG: hypothetical protein ACYCWW_13795 [Deltaproteobacteria bacterium]
MELALSGPIGRRDQCGDCGSDLHSCAQCRFYDPSASNQCREPQAERVQDKERSNYCEYFQLDGTPGGSRDAVADEAKRRLEQLFKK